MKYITFRSMNPMYGRERKFSRSTLNYNEKFPLKCKCKQSLIKWQLSIVSFSNTSTISIIWFSKFSKTKRIFERKTFCCSLFKKDSDYDSKSTENQINKQANNPIHSFNESKNKEQTNVVFSNAKENDLSNHKKMRKTKQT